MDLSIKKCPVWIGGDLTLPEVDWEERSVISHPYSKDLNDKFLEVYDNFSLE